MNIIVHTQILSSECLHLKFHQRQVNSCWYKSLKRTVVDMLPSFRLKIVALLVMFLDMQFGALDQSASVPASTVGVADTTIYNLISASGATVLVSGLDPLKVVVSATSGALKVTTTTGLSAPKNKIIRRALPKGLGLGDSICGGCKKLIG